MFDKIKEKFVGTLEIAEAHCDGARQYNSKVILKTMNPV